MDDTHVDLLFDESSGRNIQTPPRSRTPPSISVTDVSQTPDHHVTQSDTITTATVSPAAATSSE